MKLLLASALLGISSLVANCHPPQQPEQDPAAKPSQAQSEAWLTDFAKAKELAKQQGKDLLVDFTGSDWCGWCIRLKEEVFDQKEFADAHKKFVFVELDFPRQKKLSPELRKQNESLQAKFAIQGFPAILLLDAEGLPYAQTGYQPGGPVKYLEHLTELQKNKTTRDEALAKAKAAKGVEAAQLYAQAHDQLPQEVQRHYTHLMDQIIQLDADGNAGLKSKYEGIKAQLAAEAEFRAVEQKFGEAIEAGDFDGAKTAVNQFMTEKKPAGEALQKAHYLLGLALIQSGDASGASASFKKGHEVDPQSQFGKALGQMAERAAAQAKASPTDVAKPPAPKKEGK